MYNDITSPPTHKLRICRKNDSIFGHDLIGDADGILSPSKDVIESTARAIPIPVSNYFIFQKALRYLC